MRKVKSFLIAMVACVGAMQASPALACTYFGPVPGMTPVTYTGQVSASQNVYLWPGSSIVSPNGVYRLIFQNDGNLVLYKNETQYVWDTNTELCTPTPERTFAARFQPDGNLVVYHALQSNSTVPLPASWDANTQGNPTAVLKVQDDGNVVIYRGTKAIWARTW